MQQGNATFRQDIADVLQENNLGEGEFVGEQIMPIMPVAAKSGQFAKLAFAGVKTKAVDDKRASTGNYNEVTHEVSTDNYTSVKRGLIEPVDDDDAKVLGKYFDAEVSAANHCRYYLRLNREARIAAIAFSTSVMAGYTSAVSTKWSTAATCTPVADVEYAKELITVNLNGMRGAGARIIGVGNITARRHLRASSDIKDRVYAGGNVQRGLISEAQIAEILGLDAVYFSALKRGGSDIWGATKFGIYLVSTSTQLRSAPMFGKTMLWRDSTPTDMMVETYRDENRESDIVRVKHHSVEKLLTARAGYLYTNIT
jgi:hypothetical protein